MRYKYEFDLQDIALERPTRRLWEAEYEYHGQRIPYEVTVSRDSITVDIMMDKDEITALCLDCPVWLHWIYQTEHDDAACTRDPADCHAGGVFAYIADVALDRFLRAERNE